MGTETNKEERNTPEYLAQLLKDKKQIQAFPNVFLHLERLLDEGKFSVAEKWTPIVFSWPKVTRYWLSCSNRQFILHLRKLVTVMGGYLVEIGCSKAGGHGISMSL